MVCLLFHQKVSGSMWVEVFDGPLKTARGPRALPTATTWLRLSPFKKPCGRVPAATQNCLCGRVGLCGDCTDIHGGGCTRGAFLAGAGSGPVTPANGMRPVGLLMSFPTVEKECPAGLKAGRDWRKGSGAAAGWGEKLAGVGVLSGAAGDCSSARTRSMPASCSGVGLGRGSDESKGLAQMESIRGFMLAGVLGL